MIRVAVVGMLCVGMWLLPATPASADSAVYYLTSSGDDTVAYSGGENYYTIPQLYCPYGNNTRLSFARWSIGIPAGATIQSAVVKVCSTGERADANPSTVRIELLDEDSAQPFTTSPFSRPVTAAYVDWTVPGTWTQGQWYTSEDVTSLVQAFVDRPSYAVNNYLGLRLSQVAGTFKRAYQYDYGAHTSGARLEVTYTVQANTPPVADAGPNQTVTDADDSGYEIVTLDGSDSSDSDGYIVSWVWKEAGNVIGAGETIQPNLSVGTHTITLEVTDNQAATDEATVQIVVNEPAAVALSYAYGTPNATYQYRPLIVTANDGETDICQMRFFVPLEGQDHTGHLVAEAGTLAEFYDLAYGATAFNYSPEGAVHNWSEGLLEMGGFAGATFSDAGGQTAAYYEFMREKSLATAVTATLTVCIAAPVCDGADYIVPISGTVTITNASGSDYDLANAYGVAGSGLLALRHGGYTTWSIVNPTQATGKPNAHLTDVTDGHQLYDIYDWYGSTVVSNIPGFHAKHVVKDNAATQALNMRPGLTFELQCPDMDFGYNDAANQMYGSTLINATDGVVCRITNQRKPFGNGAMLATGQSVSMQWNGVISTVGTQFAPWADAGTDQNIDAGLQEEATVILDGSGSFDVEGPITSYVWTLGGNTIATTETAQVVLGAGTHVITLTVTDADDTTDDDSVTVVVTNRLPKTYYVDQGHPSANDDNPGSEALPLLTISRGAELAQAGDTVIVKAGIYRESVMPAYSGDDGNPITFQANPGDRVVVSGAEEITGWQQLTQELSEGNPNHANIYYKDINWVPRLLYEDGVKCRKARKPDYGWWCVTASSDSYHVIDSVHLTQADPNYWVGAEMYFVNYDPAESDDAVVTAYDPATHTVTVSPWVATEYGNDGPEAGEDYYYLSNKIVLMDHPGEWCCKSLGGGQYRLYVWPHDSGSPSGHMFEAGKNILPLLNWAGRSGIVYDGFEVRHCNGHNAVGSTGSASDVVVSNCIIHDNNHFGVLFTTVNGGTLRNSLVIDNGYGVVINVYCQSIDVYENEIARNVEEDGVTITYGNSDIYVARNYIHHHCFWGHPDSFQVYSIEEVYGACDGITLDSNVMMYGFQAGLIQHTINVLATNNVCVGSVQGLFQLGLGAHDTVIDHNVFALSGVSPFSLEESQPNHSLTNNIYYDGNHGPFYHANSTQGYASDHNVFCHASGLPAEQIIIWNGVNSQFAAYVAASGQDTHSYYADPLFVNAPIFITPTSLIAVPHYTTAKLYLAANASHYLVGDHIEVAFDGVMRTITATGTDAHGDYIEFAPAMNEPLFRIGGVANWKTKADCQLDFSVLAGSPAAGNGSGGSNIGSSINVQQYQQGDFTGDNVRDIPAWPPQN